MINTVNPSSKYAVPALIRVIPANCPAEVRFVREIKIAVHFGMPAETAISPNVKETGIYPRQIGIPCFTPVLKSLLIIINLIIKNSIGFKA